MSAISQVLNDILHARFGKDVRQAIHDGIELGYNIASDAQVKAETAQDSASASATAAANSASAAQTAANNASISAGLAEQYKEEAFHTTPAGYEDFVSETNSSLADLYQNGVKNLCPPKVNFASSELGIDYTFNQDGTITVNGTATSANVAILASHGLFTLKAGQYHISGAPTNDAILQLQSDAGANLGTDNGSGVDVTITYDRQVKLVLYVYQSHGEYQNVIVKPMITLKSVANSDYAHYVPFALPNSDLSLKKKLNIHSDYGDITCNNSFVIGNVLLIDFALKITTAITQNWKQYAIIDNVQFEENTSTQPTVITPLNFTQITPWNFALQSQPGGFIVLTRYNTASVDDEWRIFAIAAVL